MQLEVRKAVVYAPTGLTESMVKEARQNVDEVTDNLGMPHSTLGWLHHHPAERPAKKAKKATQTGSASPAPKINLPKRLRDGLQALPEKGEAFLEGLLDSDGSFEAAMEQFRATNVAQPVLDNPGTPPRSTPSKSWGAS